MHIVAGIYKHRHIVIPKGPQTRPTSNMLRETVFNICQGFIEGADFLDLFAGSGAMGLEALSRGAKSATFVDNSRECIRCIERNIQNFGIHGQADVRFGDVAPLLSRIEKQHKSFDIIYVDPPYGETISVKGETIPYSHYVVSLIDRSTLLRPYGSLFIEDAKTSLQPVEGLISLELKSSRRLGRSMLHEYTKKEDV